MDIAKLNLVLSHIHVGEDSVTLNPVWNFESAVATFGIEEPGTFYGARTYGLVTMTLARQGTGLVLRLALPIFILGFLAALSVCL